MNRSQTEPNPRRRQLLVLSLAVASVSGLCEAIADAQGGEPRVTQSIPPSSVHGSDMVGWLQVGPLFPRASVSARPVGSVLEVHSLNANSRGFEVLGYRVDNPRARLIAPVHGALGDDGSFRVAPQTMRVRLQATLVPTWGGASEAIDVPATNGSIVNGRYHGALGVVRLQGVFVHVPDGGAPLARAVLDLHLGGDAASTIAPVPADQAG